MPPLPINRYVNFFTPKLPTLYVLKTKDSFSWLFCHGWGVGGTSGHKARGHPFLATRPLATLLLPPLLLLSHKNLALINITCMSICLLICNSLLCQQEELSFLAVSLITVLCIYSNLHLDYMLLLFTTLYNFC